MGGSSRVINDGPRPKHAQLRDALAELAAHRAGPDVAIPSERDLMATYGVSRATVRKAIDGLVADGLLHAHPRQGHLRGPAPAGEPAAPRVVQPGHAPPRADARRPGCSASSWTSPPADVAAALQLGRRRAGLAAGPGPARRRPADRATRHGWYPEPLLPGLIRHDLGGSLYELFARRTTGCPSTRAEQTLWGEAADADVRRAARRPAAHPAPRLPAGLQPRPARPLEYVVSRYRGDRYQLHMSLGRDGVGTEHLGRKKYAVSTADAAARARERRGGGSTSPRSRSSAGA